MNIRVVAVDSLSRSRQLRLELGVLGSVVSKHKLFGITTSSHFLKLPHPVVLQGTFLTYRGKKYPYSVDKDRGFILSGE